MPKNERALPDGFMTVGKLAERMGVTVRTLQYYDREGLLSPTAESGGGRRLYTDKDMIQLHQILSLKSLGFSLDDIKNRLAPLDTPADVADALAAQAAAVREKIAVLTESLTAIETLRAEVLQMQTVDFKKYADIIVNLQMKNEFYWLIKHFDERTLDHIRSRFDKESGRAMLARGFSGRIPEGVFERPAWKMRDTLFLAVWCSAFVLLRLCRPAENLSMLINNL